MILTSAIYIKETNFLVPINYRKPHMITLSSTSLLLIFNGTKFRIGYNCLKGISPAVRTFKSAFRLTESKLSQMLDKSQYPDHKAYLSFLDTFLSTQLPKLNRKNIIITLRRLRWDSSTHYSFPEIYSTIIGRGLLQEYTADQIVDILYSLTECRVEVARPIYHSIADAIMERQLLDQISTDQYAVIVRCFAKRGVYPDLLFETISFKICEKADLLTPTSAASIVWAFSQSPNDGVKILNVISTSLFERSFDKFTLKDYTLTLSAFSHSKTNATALISKLVADYKTKRLFYEMRVTPGLMVDSIASFARLKINDPDLMHQFLHVFKLRSLLYTLDARDIPKLLRSLMLMKINDPQLNANAIKALKSRRLISLFSATEYAHFLEYLTFFRYNPSGRDMQNIVLCELLQLQKEFNVDQMISVKKYFKFAGMLVDDSIWERVRTKKATEGLFDFLDRKKGGKVIPF